MASFSSFFKKIQESMRSKGGSFLSKNFPALKKTLTEKEEKKRSFSSYMSSRSGEEELSDSEIFERIDVTSSQNNQRDGRQLNQTNQNQMTDTYSDQDSGSNTFDDINIGNNDRSDNDDVDDGDEDIVENSMHEPKIETDEEDEMYSDLNVDQRIYFDYASLTPIDPRVKKVMIDAMDEYSANPSSLYKEGVKAKKALQEARTSIGHFFSTQPDEIIFTSGGTESNNLVFQGVLAEFEANDRESDESNVQPAAGQAKQGQSKSSKTKVDKNAGINTNADTGSNTHKPHFIISTIEHPSIVEISLDLISRGYEVSFVPVNNQGLVDPKDIKKALRPETILVSVMYANNEIGTVQPIKDIAREIRHYKKSLGRNASGYPYFHTDACQAALYEDMRVATLGVDMLTIDGGKVYGPRSTGVLVRRRHVALAPLFHGGSQESGFRAGTENVPAIIGLKHALDIAHSERDEMVIKMQRFGERLHDLLIARLMDLVPGIALNGHPENRLPNNINICFPGLDAEFLVLRLDALGVAVSSVTSCRANDEDSSSYVVEALGKSNCAQSSLRITFGRFTTPEEIAIAIEKITQAVKEQIRNKVI